MASLMDIPDLYPPTHAPGRTLSPPCLSSSGPARAQGHCDYSAQQYHGQCGTHQHTYGYPSPPHGYKQPRSPHFNPQPDVWCGSQAAGSMGSGAQGPYSPVLRAHPGASMTGVAQNQHRAVWSVSSSAEESFAMPHSPTLHGFSSLVQHEAHSPYSQYHVPQVGVSAKTKVCRYYLSRNNNHFGRSCSYVHPCRNMLITGACKHGKRCTDDHVCRSYILYGESGPQGCQSGDSCKLIHVKQEGDRAALIDMYRDWIAVKQHEVLATQALGSAAAAASVVQTEVMLAAAVISPQARISCPFFYSDTQAGCKAGPDCVYEHAGQFQLPTRPLPTDAQNKFAEKAWEKRRAQEAAATVATSPVMSVRTSHGSASTASTLSLQSIASPHIATPTVRSLSGSDSGLDIHALSLGDPVQHGSSHGAPHGKALSAHMHAAAPAPDMSPLLHPSPVITQALQMATIISGPSSSTSASDISPKLSAASHPARQASRLGAYGRQKRGTPLARVEGGPAPGTLGADLLLPAPAGHSSLFPSTAAQDTQVGLGLPCLRDINVGSLQNALDGLTLR